MPFPIVVIFSPSAGDFGLVFLAWW